MDIMVKCPNCFQQVSDDNEYCIYCGSRLNVKAPLMKETDKTIEYSGPRYCPNGHRVSNPMLGFCDVCGEVLVYEPKAGKLRKPSTTAKQTHEMADRMDTAHKAIKVCPNGHKFDDPELIYCPECGMPFPTTVKIKKRWECSCGAQNELTEDYCTQCGKERVNEPFRKRDLKPSVIKSTHPDGMFVPTDEDLAKKSKRR